MRPNSSSCLPSTNWRSSSVSAAHFCFSLPLVMFQSPLISSVVIMIGFGFRCLFLFVFNAKAKVKPHMVLKYGLIRSRRNLVAHPLARFRETVCQRVVSFFGIRLDAVPGGLGRVRGVGKLLV